LYYRDLKDHDKAIEIYQQAVELDVAYALYALSFIYFKENHVETFARTH
jgi:tetratricopeptide (TPR) repeat protein